MRRSDERFLTTHAGSLPRPPELVRLYVRRAQGEAVDPAALAAAGREALRWVVPKQIEAGVDVGNNGEQQREGFFLYVQHRMSGFGGAWQRRPRGDVVRYPVFQRMLEEQTASRTAISDFRPPKAIGAVRYLDPALVNAECLDFQAALDEAGGSFVEPFLTAPSPGHRRRGDQERTLRHRGRLPRRARGCAPGRIRGDRRPWLPATARLPGSGARAPHRLPGPAACGVSRLRRARGRGDQSGARARPA
jgi:hypothetical protein